MQKDLNMNRRDFLKLGAVSIAGLTVIPFLKPLVNANATAVIEPKTTISKRDWAIRWSQWAFSYSDTESPILDENGKILMKEQPKGQDMFFLTGGYTANGKADSVQRTITVPKSSIFFPIIMGTWGYGDDMNFKNDEEIKQKTIQEMDTVSKLECTLDGHIVPYERVNSGELFYQYYPESKHYPQINKGISRGFLDGYWVLLPPLSEGKHVIHLYGRLEKEIGTDQPYENEVTYFINA